MKKRTKIVATLGPASDSREILSRLLSEGVNVFRLNFSHGDLESKRELIKNIRETADNNSLPVAILADLQGPKIRVGMLKDNAMELTEGNIVVFTTADIIGDGNVIPTTYEALPDDLKEGDRILLDDGLLEVLVIKVENREVHCRVIVGGTLKNRKGMNLPGIKVSAPSLTEKDKADLEFCIEQDVDYVALSFVRSAECVETLKNILRDRKSGIAVISKIEKPEAVGAFDEILEVSDGIMVARGDLGVEINPERVPFIQKEIIRKCNQVGKPVITATQMLESMISNPRATRAETSDVANAIIDGTDAVMLSAETASGKYPVEAVGTMSRIALDVEKSMPVENTLDSLRLGTRLNLVEAIGYAACFLSETIQAAGILAFTQTGGTAALVSKHRPRVPVIAATPSESVRRKLALYHGVYSIIVENTDDTEKQIGIVEKSVIDAGLFRKNDLTVITMGSPVSCTGTTNLVKAMRLGS